MRIRRAAGVALIALLAFALSCSKPEPVEVAMPNERPTIELSTAPQNGDSVFYEVKFTWFSYDPDGSVSSFRYAVDPPLQGDTAWVSTTDHELELKFRSATPGGSTPTGIAGTDYHAFVIEAVDDRGLNSLPASDVFTSYTVAPQARVTYPTPSRMGFAQTPISVHLLWTGIDPDGPGDKRPVKYKFRLVDQATIQSALGLGQIAPSASDLQSYFSIGAPGFASWDSSGADSTLRTYDSLGPGQVYYFAVLAFDEVGAYDPRFDLDRNLLRFRPQIGIPGPRLIVQNDLVVAQGFSMDLSPERYAHLAIPTGEAVRFDWNAIPQPGSSVLGYRWVLDPVNGDIGDETPRSSDTQTYRWSQWAFAEKSVTVGPFDGPLPHYLYIEARDNAGGQSIVPIQMNVVVRTSQFLVVDDVNGPPDMDNGPSSPYSFQPYGNFPTEAVLDTLLYAVGGKPYQHRPPGTLSLPGMFSGFDYDTLDYRFRRAAGLPQELLFRYRAVIIYTTLKDVLNVGFGAGNLDALRYVTFSQTPNPLAAYVAHGGKLWLFGDGIIYAFMLKPGDQVLQMSKVPKAGSFPYDYMRLRSTFGIGGGSAAVPDYMVGATPYLPGYKTPGTPWPLDTVTTYVRGSCDDPRVGPGAARNAARWDGLPCLNLTTEFNNWPSGFVSGVKGIFYVATPLSVLEVLDLNTQKTGSGLDTLYLWKAVNYIGGRRSSNPDGKPVMCAYEGINSGPVVWTGMPLWYFDREQLRQLAATVLGSFGIQRAGDPSTFHGPGSAEHVDDEPPNRGGGPTASARPSE